AQTLPHHVFREISDVVLKGVRNESPAHPDPRFALVMQPIPGLNRLLHRAVEIVVVRELNVPADIPPKAILITEAGREPAHPAVSLHYQVIMLPGFLEPIRRPQT